MTSHPYLDLQQGNVENYCMMAPKAEVPQWYEQGWLPHYAVGLSRREANRASMVYGFMRFKRDVLLFSRPEYLAAKSPVGRKIVGFCTHLGTYGMGGPGFFGLLLGTDEYLVYTAWHAGYSTLLDNRAVKMPPYGNTATRSWVGNLNGAEWDELSPLLIGCEIADCSLADHRCTLQLQKDGQTHLLEFVRQDERIPSTPDQKPRLAYEDGKIADYLMYQHKNAWLVA